MMIEFIVKDICALAVEPNEPVKVWSATPCTNVYEGTFRELMWSNEPYAKAIVESFSCEDGCLVINIE